MEKINIAELLKDCPRGMELDCVLCENVTFGCIVDGNCFPIQIQTPEGDMLLSKYGCTSLSTHAKCVIFPKGKTTWDGIVAPFSNGDIVATDDSVFIGIVRKVNQCETEDLYDHNEEYAVHCYIASSDDNGVYEFETGDVSLLFSRLATEEEKQKLFKAIKDNGYKWNAETKTLEKLIEPKFKVGDRIKYKNGKNIDGVEQGIILSITDDTYDVIVSSDMGILVAIVDQDNWELVPNKFDITALRPFDKVLARDTDDSMWIATLFSHLRGMKFYTVSSWYNQCIPFEGNEHLLGKTDNCIDFYKNWE